MSSGFFDSRTGWRQLKHWLLLEPLPGGSRWAAAFGSLLLFSFLVQVLTGILLSMNYSPSVESAWPSVNYIMTDVRFGSLVRSLHHWGSSAMVVLLLVHIVQVFVWGAYKKPREFTWMAGVLLLFATLGLAFTGYLLPWDQKAYWATKVGLGIISTIPLVGENLKTLLQGGPQMGNLTLTRFFALHVFVLPGLLIALVVAHLYLFRRHGVTPPWWESERALEAQREPFWPGQAFKDAVMALLFLIALIGWAYWRPAPLEPPSDPAQLYEARPEWYFMFLFYLLQFFKGPYEVVGTFILPILIFLVLFFWPFLDRSPHRDPRRRPIAMSLLGLGTTGLIGLTVFAIVTDMRMREPALAVAQSPPAPPPAGPLQKLDVINLYDQNCASCHSVDGTGRQIRAAAPTTPDFTSLAWQMSQTDLELTHRIQEGKAPLMPAYRDKLSQDQIVGLAIYVRAFAVEPIAVAATPTTPPPSEIQPPESAVPQATARPAAAPAPEAPAAEMSSIQIYRNYCLACHDTDGRGAIVRKAMPAIPDFTDPQWQDSRSDADFRQAIMSGRGTFMLPMKDKLGRKDVEDLVAQVRSFTQAEHRVPLEPAEPVTPLPLRAAVVPEATTPEPPQSPPTASSERIGAAAQLYRQYCLICHGTNGSGGPMRPSMPVIPDFADPAWQRGHSDPQLIVGILDGKGTLMPAFRGRVNDQRAADLAAYIRAFGPARLPVQGPTTDFDTRFRQLQSQWEELQRQLHELRRPAPPP